VSAVIEPNEQFSAAIILKGVNSAKRSVKRSAKKSAKKSAKRFKTQDGMSGPAYPSLLVTGITRASNYFSNTFLADSPEEDEAQNRG
jgi:hypothetical protein